jgi:hypothetical protein
MKEKRKHRRLDAALPVTIRGIDCTGSLFMLHAVTADITPAGARILGVECRLDPGANIAVQHEGKKALFRVAWVGEIGSPQANQIGVHVLDPSKQIFNLPVLTFNLCEPEVPAALFPAQAAGD